MVQFWVVGGEDDGADLERLLARGQRWIGPFGAYESARQEWERRCRDGAAARRAARYRIEHIDPDSPPPCTD
jgi:hypothetical protein